MKDLLDVHIHTIASIHAYSTIRESIAAAKERGLELVGISDHGPALPGSIHEMYFRNFKVIRDKDFGIGVVMGVELNIMDFSGSTDLREDTIKRLDYAIASLHDLCITPGTVEQNTAAIIGAMRNPYVKIIGHPDNPQYPVDFDVIARAAKENHVLLEANNSSYVSTGSRAGSREKAAELLAACKRCGTMVIMGSDAHIDLDVGNHASSREVIEAAGFPEELVINRDAAAFLDFITRQEMSPNLCRWGDGCK